MSYQVKKLTGEQLTDEVKKLYDAGSRLITATCIDENECFRIIYSFDKELEMVNLELSISKCEDVPSICNIYECAFLIENEMKELYGVNITNIPVDFGGHLYLTKDMEKTPMANKQKKEAKGGE